MLQFDTVTQKIRLTFSYAFYTRCLTACAHRLGQASMAKEWFRLLYQALPSQHSRWWQIWLAMLCIRNQEVTWFQLKTPRMCSRRICSTIMYTGGVFLQHVSFPARLGGLPCVAPGMSFTFANYGPLLPCNPPPLLQCHPWFLLCDKGPFHRHRVSPEFD